MDCVRCIASDMNTVVTGKFRMEWNTVELGYNAIEGTE
jgi:hypothetical protein